MFQKPYKILSLCAILAGTFALTACNSYSDGKHRSTAKRTKISQSYKTNRGSISDPIFALSSLTEHQRNWKGTRYRLGGTTRRGIDCSAFMQVTFRDLFSIDLPRTTVEQAQEGFRVSKNELRAGDLVFFKTGRGPNGKHVGVYVKNGQFLHASSRGGVIYSNINEPYWTRTFWQARRL